LKIKELQEGMNHLALSGMGISGQRMQQLMCEEFVMWKAKSA
jgi:hypothetical protein